MKLAFEFDVAFMAVPMPPPTKENCDKCCFFDRQLCSALTDYSVCGYGEKGYFVCNKLYGRFTGKDT